METKPETVEVEYAYDGIYGVRVNDRPVGDVSRRTIQSRHSQAWEYTRLDGLVSGSADTKEQAVRWLVDESRSIWAAD